MACPLDRATVVPSDMRTPWFDHVARKWPDGAAADRLRGEMHRRDLEAAARPPVVHVTVPGLPGHFTATAGQEGFAYSPDPSPA
jgi:hypothetical protein